jgi:HlyD family secretion protein
MKRKRKLILLPVAALLIIGGIALYGIYGMSPEEPGIIRVSGNIEATDAHASFQVAGRVAERLAAEGQAVERGELLARLDTSELAQQVAIREAQVQGARATLDELEAGSRTEEVAVARATFERAQVEMTQQQRDYQRLKELYQQNAVPRQQYEQAQTAYEVAQARVREAREQLHLVEKGPRPEKIEQARAALEQAKQTLEMDRIRLGYGPLYAPLSGVVLSKHIEAGEYVVPGTPVVTLADLDDIWLRAYVGESDLGRIKLGQEVEVTTDSYPGKVYPGRLSFIASEAEFTPKSVQTREQRVKLVYRIKIDVANPDRELKPGMPADAKIITDEVAHARSNQGTTAHEIVR